MTSMIRSAAAIAALIALASPALLHAENWQKVADLPGGMSEELDKDSIFEALDGVRLVVQAKFRRQMPTATMETAVAVDCVKGLAKIRGVRLLDGERVMSESVSANAEYLPIHEGSAEDIYFMALCDGQKQESAD